MSDVLLFQTIDDGNITVEAGIVELSPGLETAAYLSMFGGDEWWGNISEQETARQYTSKTEELIDRLNPSSANLQRIEEGVLLDLAWFIEEKVATSVTAEATVPELNKLNLSVTITAEGDETDLQFTVNWKASV